MTEFVRFPHTPHLAWLGAGQPRDDKVLSGAAAQALLACDLVVEEKVDGANLGLSVDESGVLRAQNRGSYLDLASPAGQWKPLTQWLASRHDEMVKALGVRLILFGEWCYAVHSLHYTMLPSWFLAFDVYDRREARFWSVERRNALVKELDLALVPQLGTGRFDLPALRKLMKNSCVTDGPAEGVYLRHDAGGLLEQRAKLVHPDFVQGIAQHWSRRELQTNRLGSR